MRISDWSSDVCSSDLPDSDPATVLAHCTMTRLGVAFAENPALTPHWRDLVDGTRGTCVVVDGKAGTVEVAGPERLEISIAGQRYAAEPDAPIRFDPRDGVLLLRADRRESPCWPGDPPCFRPIFREIGRASS